MRKAASVLLLLGFVFYVLSLTAGIFTGTAQESPGGVGLAVLRDSPERAGAANTVTSVVVMYRGFDTLGEVTVLFLAALGVGLLLHGVTGSGGTAKDRGDTASGERARGKNASGERALGDTASGETAREASGFILSTGAKVLLPFFFLFGLYVISHGHLSPGGGFPGGVIVATGFFTALLTGGLERERKGLFSLLEGLAGLSFIGMGFAGLYGFPGSFLAQVLPTGEFGSLFSGGIVPLLYAVVGVKVASELSSAVATLYFAGPTGDYAGLTENHAGPVGNQASPEENHAGPAGNLAGSTDEKAALSSTASEASGETSVGDAARTGDQAQSGEDAR